MCVFKTSRYFISTSVRSTSKSYDAKHAHGCLIVCEEEGEDQMKICTLAEV